MTITLYGITFQLFLLPFNWYVSVLQPQYCRNNTGLGFSPFARHYLGNHFCFLFLQVLRCFSSLGLLPIGWYLFKIPGYPIQKSSDLLLFAHPRSLSQLITSFFAYESQGIHHAPLFTFFLLLVSLLISFSLVFFQYVKERCLTFQLNHANTTDSNCFLCPYSVSSCIFSPKIRWS